MRSQRFLFVVLVLVLGLVGCRKPRTFVLSKEQQKQIQGALLEAVPTVEHPVGALFDGGVKLVGVDLERDTVKAGQRLKVTWVWEVVGEIPPGQWMIFVHFENPGKKRTTHDHQAVGELHPVKNWKKGDVIRDVQTIDVAKDFPSGPADLYVGLFDEGAWRDRRENIRMKVTNDSEPTVHVDKEGRLRAATVKIAGKGIASDRASHTRARNHRVYRAASSPTMDGRLDEVLWRGARPTAPFVQPHGQVLSPKWMTQARLLWDDDALYVGISGRDDDVTNTNLTHDSTLWKQDVFEIYLDPGSDGVNYVELQISPTGVTFDAVFVKHRRPKWQEAAKEELAGLEAFAAVEGSVNDASGEPDSRWSVEVKIPWASLPGMDGPPTAGDELAANFYRIDVKTDTRAGFMGAWSPAGGDFHNTSGFGKLRFLAAAPPPKPASRRPTLPGTGAAAAAKAASKSGLISRPLKRTAPPAAAPGKPPESGTRPASTRPIPRLTPSIQRALRSGALRPSKGASIPPAPTGKKP